MGIVYVSPDPLPPAPAFSSPAQALSGPSTPGDVPPPKPPRTASERRRRSIAVPVTPEDVARVESEAAERNQ